jgi:hypothetical protein
MKWITRSHVKVDRIACPWLIKRFIDPQAVFEFRDAKTTDFSKIPESEGITYDAPGARFGHVGPRCSFDALVEHYALTDPAILLLARIVRTADTDDPQPVPEGAGLRAIATGFARLFRADDMQNNERQWLVYDALYEFCKAQVERSAM